MTIDSTDSAATPLPADKVKKRPYSKPGFSHETVFETMALACGKIRGQGQEQCRRVSSNS